MIEKRPDVSWMSGIMVSLYKSVPHNETKHTSSHQASSRQEAMSMSVLRQLNDHWSRCLIVACYTHTHTQGRAYKDAQVEEGSVAGGVSAACMVAHNGEGILSSKCVFVSPSLTSNSTRQCEVKAY